MILPGIRQVLYPLWRLVWLNILHITCVCTTFTPQSIETLWVEKQQWLLPNELRVQSWLFCSGSTLQSSIITEDTIQPAYHFLIIITQASNYFGNSPIHCSEMICPYCQLLRGSSRGITHNATMRQHKAHCGDCSDDKRDLLCCANNFQQTMCMIMCWILYI